ncbi:MAG: serine/threonine-protein phosphatase [bacterium]|nr:serine/threonine-protein phosphatase [bacterium]
MYVRERDRSATFAVADVVGHGVSAAMYAGMLRSTLDAARRRDPDPRRLIGELLDGIDFFDPPRGATLFYAHLLCDGRVRYFSAGHLPVLWLTRQGRVRRLEATGLPLSTFFRDRPYEIGEIRLDAGDRLLAFTDGIPEAMDPAENEFGLDGVEKSFAAGAKLAPGAVLASLLEEVERHAGGRPSGDDSTLLIVERGRAG